MGLLQEAERDLPKQLRVYCEKEEVATQNQAALILHPQ